MVQTSRKPLFLTGFAVLPVRRLLYAPTLIEAMYPGERLIHLFVDNARYHYAKLVQAWLARPGCRIKLHFIPTCCPHLDPAERLWGSPCQASFFSETASTTDGSTIYSGATTGGIPLFTLLLYGSVPPFNTCEPPPD